MGGFFKISLFTITVLPSIVVLCLQIPVYSQEAATPPIPSPSPISESKKDIQDDFFRVCKLSKEGRTLAQQKKYRLNPAALVVIMSQKFDKVIKTQTVHRVREALTSANGRTKERLWHQAAKEAGLKNWRCPGVSQGI